MREEVSRVITKIDKNKVRKKDMLVFVLRFLELKVVHV